MKYRNQVFSFLSIAAAAAPAVADDAGTVACADRSVTAAAVSTRQDVASFVQCAYEYVEAVGPAEARRAFNEDARWKHGPTYLFVNTATPASHEAVRLVFPPDPAREGMPRGMLGDAFGDHFREIYRIVDEFGEGWVYYGFNNPATGRIEPKITYVKGLDWDGAAAVIGAGIYSRDLPGACEPGEVHARGLESHPSPERLSEFVRCAAMELESKGYFAGRTLASDPRWRGPSTYVFGMDIYGNTVFTGDPDSRWYGTLESEVNTNTDGPFLGRDIIGVGDVFGETFLYYSARNPATGTLQRKTTFLKRVVVSGLPILLASGYYLD